MIPSPSDPRPPSPSSSSSSSSKSFSGHRTPQESSPNKTLPTGNETSPADNNTTPADNTTSPTGNSNAFLRLGDLALTRSGDKGNHVNLGVVAFSKEDYDFLVATLTEARVAEYFANCRPTKVARYLLPRVWSLNFLLYNALEGGASQSLRLDSQGKLFGVTAAEIRLPPHHSSKSQEPDT